jgi:hypothetical protein
MCACVGVAVVDIVHQNNIVMIPIMIVVIPTVWKYACRSTLDITNVLLGYTLVDDDNVTISSKKPVWDADNEDIVAVPVVPLDDDDVAMSLPPLDDDNDNDNDDDSIKAVDVDDDVVSELVDEE